MNFDTAKQKAEQGFVMTRPGWPQTFTGAGPDEHGEYPLMLRRGTDVEPFEPTDEDLAATDWSVL